MWAGRVQNLGKPDKQLNSPNLYYRKCTEIIWRILMLNLTCFSLGAQSTLRAVSHTHSSATTVSSRDVL